MIRVLFGAGTAAAANGITADVDVSLDAAGAGSAGDDFTVTASVEAGSATGEGFSAGIVELAALSISGGDVTAGAALDGYDETITTTLIAGGAPANGINSTVTISLTSGVAGSGVVLPAIGDAFEGGFYAGLISHTADGVATHALIVAPRATGATGTGYPIPTNLLWKTSNTTTPGTTSSFDGAANTAAMVAAGIADHPAANFCVGLSIGGYSDWYLPALFELDIAYSNLKPGTGNNTTTSGINPYSVPERTSNYTAGGAPLQTSATAFRTGGSQVFETNFHWPSNEENATQANGIRFLDGLLFLSGKGNGYRVRAFRRVAL
jgi:hypothetical protein